MNRTGTGVVIGNGRFDADCYNLCNMATTKIAGGVVHRLPADMKNALVSEPDALAAWEDITPLARNEWICWIESAKKTETRQRRIEWGCSSLKEGKRRPCCWPGCPHRQVEARVDRA
ncbi:MAG TPA: YdeI/OmpD-associated family protein [Acidobacteriaceae bacterium]|nr:YdeI/OmpD-associated family protein [Acidobacteriaceae bacterium]